MKLWSTRHHERSLQPCKQKHEGARHPSTRTQCVIRPKGPAYRVHPLPWAAGRHSSRHESADSLLIGGGKLDHQLTVRLHGSTANHRLVSHKGAPYQAQETVMQKACPKYRSLKTMIHWPFFPLKGDLGFLGRSMAMWQRDEDAQLRQESLCGEGSDEDGAWSATHEVLVPIWVWTNLPALLQVHPDAEERCIVLGQQAHLCWDSSSQPQTGSQSGKQT